MNMNMNMNVSPTSGGWPAREQSARAGGGWEEGVSLLPHQGVFEFWRFKRLQNMCLLKRGMTGEGEKRLSDPIL